jgi:hypothetical protein
VNKTGTSNHISDMPFLPELNKNPQISCSKFLALIIIGKICLPEFIPYICMVLFHVA